MIRRDYQAIAESFKLLMNDKDTPAVTLAAAMGHFMEYAEAHYDFDRTRFIGVVISDIKAKREAHGNVPPVS